MVMKKDNVQIKNDLGFPKMENGYTVPEGYFDSFSERLRIKMEAEALPLQKKVPVKSVLFYLKPALGLAAGLAILLMVYMHTYDNQAITSLVAPQNSVVLQNEDPSELLPLPKVFAYLVTDGQFFSALSDMDEYDDAKISKEVLVDYLASNCSDFEILNASK